jgi:hypothetical protein
MDQKQIDDDAKDRQMTDDLGRRIHGRCLDEPSSFFGIQLLEDSNGIQAMMTIVGDLDSGLLRRRFGVAGSSTVSSFGNHADRLSSSWPSLACRIFWLDKLLLYQAINQCDRNNLNTTKN